jgi:hypothetical protein
MNNCTHKQGAIMKKSARFTIPRLQRRGRYRQDGVTMVEFAIVSPLAVLFVFAIIQLGLTFSAKAVLNEAAFMAAREGSVQNASKDHMDDALEKALIPFYQDTTERNAVVRLGAAWLASKRDAAFMKIERLSPSDEAFDDFGLPDGDHTNIIPNDNLDFRPHSVKGPTSGLSIQDANALKIKVTYGYKIKVPLMESVIKSVMCGFDTGINAFGRGGPAPAGNDCSDFYNQGRIPIVAYATVQMQTPAWQN